MPKEQLDAVKEQLMSEENDELRQSVFSAYLEEPERGANMIIAFATDKGFKLDATSNEVVDYMNALDDDDIDVELTPEILTQVSGGKGSGPNISQAERDMKRHPNPGMRHLVWEDRSGGYWADGGNKDYWNK